MTLTTHIAIAAAITRPIAHVHPALTFVIALATHYLSDAIPHWDYELHSPERDESTNVKKISIRHPKFGGDFIKMSLDGTLGLALMWFIVGPVSFETIIWMGLAAVGSCLPDFLQGVYTILGLKFLEPVHRFHNRMHTRIRLGPYPLIGVPFQLAILLIAVYFLI
ncbi:MAG: hypothetical protein HYT98_02985 [Candidatus Sungbacteria bacterium]|nr:hypothetical protein [Candidatus Sungbacteria bacterium]